MIRMNLLSNQVRQILHGESDLIFRLAYDRNGNVPRRPLGEGERFGFREPWGYVDGPPKRVAYQQSPSGKRFVTWLSAFEKMPPKSYVTWENPATMPKWAVQLVVTVEATWMQSLGDIRDAEIQAAGYDGIAPFVRDWDRIHTVSGDTFDTNPMVRAIRVSIAEIRRLAA